MDRAHRRGLLDGEGQTAMGRCCWEKERHVGGDVPTWCQRQCLKGESLCIKRRKKPRLQWRVLLLVSAVWLGTGEGSFLRGCLQALHRGKGKHSYGPRSNPCVQPLL